MINVNELRIDNYVRRIIPEHDAPYYALDDCKRKEYIIKVECILPGGINLTEANKIEYHYEDAFGYIEGIPLTSEWLGRCGFVADRNGWHIPDKQFSLTDKFYPCWLDRMLWPQDIADFKQLSLEHVHQLQNLYFALTGEELNVKL